MRILLVEDDDMIGQAVQEALESNAYAIALCLISACLKWMALRS